MAYSVVHAEGRLVPNENGGTDMRYIYELLLDSSDDTSDTPADALPGSRAYTADLSYAAILNNSSEWTAIVGGSDSEEESQEEES